MKVEAFAMILASTTATVAAPAAISRGIREDDYARMVGLSQPAVSPDGKRAVVIVSRIVLDRDKRDSDLVLIDLATRAQRVLTYNRTGLSDPAFSPDGTRLAFIADDGSGDDATSQVFVMPFDGGDARPITNAKDGVEQFAWRPDGKAIAYTAADPKPDRKGADRFRDSFIFTTEPIIARADPRPVHLFTIDANGGSPSQLTFGPRSVTSGEAESTLSWSPDGRTIAFVSAPNAILNDESYSRIDLIDVATRRIRPLTGHTAWESNPLFSADGKHIAYVYSRGDNQVNLTQAYVTTPAGGEGIAVSVPFDRTVQDIAWSSDSSGLLFRSNDGTSVAVVRAPLQGALQRLNLGDVMVGSTMSGAVGRDGTLVFVGSAPRQPQE